MVASLAVLAACGGDDRLSKAEFVRRADAICARYARRLERVPPPQTVADVPSYVERGIPVAEREIAELDKLRPPRQDDAEVARLLAELKTTVAELEHLGTAAAARDRDAVRSATRRVEAASARAAELARRYGFRDCGSGA